MHIAIWLFVLLMIAAFLLGVIGMYGLVVLIVKNERKTERYKSFAYGNDFSNEAEVGSGDSGLPGNR